MELPVQHKKISSLNVVLKTAGLFSGLKLIVDGEECKPKKDIYKLKNGTKIRLKGRLADPVPQVYIDGEEVHIAPPIKGFAYLWSAWPIAMLFIGGGIGAALGIAAAYLNFRIFRNTENTVKKYFFTFVVSVTAVLVWLEIITIVQSKVQGVPTN